MNNTLKDLLLSHSKEVERAIVREIYENDLVEINDGKLCFSEKFRVRLKSITESNNDVIDKIQRLIDKEITEITKTDLYSSGMKDMALKIKSEIEYCIRREI